MFGMFGLQAKKKCGRAAPFPSVTDAREPDAVATPAEDAFAVS
jgi:hypothetical protein